MSGPIRLSPSMDLYLDTSVVLAAIMPGSTNAEACAEFCSRLSAQRSRVAFSQSLTIELSQAIRKTATRKDRVEPVVRTRYELERWETDVLVRRRWMDRGIERFKTLLATFAEVVELPFDERIWLQSIDLMVEHFLQAHDAVHAATARTYGLRGFATTDADFVRVTGLDVILLRDPVS